MAPVSSSAITTGCPALPPSTTTASNSSSNNNNNNNNNIIGTTSLQDLSVTAAAIALDMKPKIDLTVVVPTQKIKKLVRRNASDKLKLIQMVHDNPILWDSRLPNFKGAEEEKNKAWEHIGREFNAPGRRVARAFKSLRESYRRELAHVKLMGNGFKPKWSLYEAMDFLRDVIRERKGGSHTTDALSSSLTLNAFAQHLHNNNNNNNNNSNSNNNNNNNNNSSLSVATSGGATLKLSSTFNDSTASATVLNLSKCGSGNALNMSQDDFFYCVKPELDLSSNANIGGATGGANFGGGGGGGSSSGSTSSTGTTLVQPLPAHQSHQTLLHQQQQQQQQQQHHNDSRVSSTRNENNLHHHHHSHSHSHSHHNLHHHPSFDDMDDSSVRSPEHNNNNNIGDINNGDASDEVEELEAIDADFPYPLILDSNSPQSVHDVSLHKHRRKLHNMDVMMDDDDDVDGDGMGNGNVVDDYEDQMLQQHRHLRQQQNAAAAAAINGGGGNNGGGLDLPPPQTVREVLNSKFCGFISAKLNSMEDSDADNLMNRILLLLVQMQQCEAAAAAAAAAKQ